MTKHRAFGIKVLGAAPPAPVTSFAHFGFDEALMKVIRKMEFTSPLPIQSQAIPIALSGRDIIGIAKTRSGKTAAFLWPALTHIIDQKELQPGDGPIALILAPTRELSIQIYNEANKFGKMYNISAVCCYGGGSKWEQSKALEQGAEIFVVTPGRMIDMVKMKATNLRRVTYLVLDEADNMFQLGFEPQVRSICNHVRPDRQTLLFSATFKKKIEKLARDVLTDPIKIIQSNVREVNEDVTQKVILFVKMVEFLSHGTVLIYYVSNKGKNLNARPESKEVEPPPTSDESEPPKPAPSIHMSRLDAMKEAFRKQYNTQFKVGADRSWEEVQTAPTFAKPTLPPPPPPLSMSSGTSSSTDASSDGKKAKRSRWN